MPDESGLRYEACFYEKLARHFSVIVNCIYWDYRSDFVALEEVQMVT